MGQKTSHIRGIRDALATAGSSIHPALVPGTASWFCALAAALFFDAATPLAVIPLPPDEVQS